MPNRTVRRASFWVTVGGVSILSNFALELVADKYPQLGLRRFTHYTHRGPGGPS